MKNAAGEANITVITIVLIGIVAAVGAAFIPRLLNNMKAQSCCIEHGGSMKDGICDGGDFLGWSVSDLKNAKECK